MTAADRERTGLSDTLVTLSKGPYTSVNRLKHYVINGLKFRSSNVEGNRKHKIVELVLPLKVAIRTMVC